MKRSEYGLTTDQVDRYHDDGWAGPFTLISEEEMADVRRKIDDEILEPGKKQGLPESKYFDNQHLYNRCVYELLSHPNLVEKTASILGPHLVLWRTNFQIKAPLSEQGDWDTEIPWHQDCAYYQISPNVNLSAWIAVDETTRENGCMQVISGSHKRLYPHITTKGLDRFSKHADPASFDAGKAVNIELKAGQFAFFNESTLHYSPPNRSEKRRFGITPRITVPFVKVSRRESLNVLMLKGEDYMGAYNVVDPPE